MGLNWKNSDIKTTGNLGTPAVNEYSIEKKIKAPEKLPFFANIYYTVLSLVFGAKCTFCSEKIKSGRRVFYNGLIFYLNYENSG